MRREGPRTEPRPDRLSRSDLRRTICGLLAVAGVLVGLGVERRASAASEGKQYTVTEAMSKKLNAALESLQAEDHESARAHLDALLERAPRLSPYARALVHQLYGHLEASQDHLEAALRHFERSLGEDALPADAQSTMRFNVAQLYISTERYREAVETLTRWFDEVEKPTSLAYYLLALSHYQLGELREAIPPAERAIESAKEPKEAWYQLLVGLLVETHEYARAIAPLEALVTMEPRKSYLLQLSALYANAGREEQSLAALQLAYQEGYLQSDSELRQLAQLYLYHQLPYRAAQVLEKGLAERKLEKTAETWGLLGNSWLLARELERALLPLRRAADLSKSGDGYVRLGQVHLEREDWEQAADAFTRALEKGDLSDPANTSLLTGISLYHLERFEEARKHFSDARERESTRDSARRWLELLERERGRT